MINNRQAGRRRGRGGQQQRSQGGGNPGRLDTGNRIDNRARGNAAQLLEKYKTLARDAQMQGDRVNVEYYLQFADHYFRVLAETRARIEENGGPVQRRIQGATLDEDDTEFEDEGERIAPAEQQRGNSNGQNGQNGYRQEGRQDTRSDGNRTDGNRQDTRSDSGRTDGNRNDTRNEQRGDGDRGYPRGSNRANGDQQNGASDACGEDQAERPRRSQNGANQDDGGYDRQRDQQRDAPRGTEDRYARTDDRTESREEQSRQDTVESEVPPVTTEQAAPTQSETVEPPRRGRGRPRRDAATTPVAPVSEAKDESADDNSFSADLLPPSLNVSAVVSDDTEADAAEKPRRRRGRPPIVRETDPVA